MSGDFEECAKQFAVKLIKAFRANSMDGPASSLIARAAELSNREAILSDGQKRTYISVGAPLGSSILVRAAAENSEAFFLAKRVAASRIAAERPLDELLRGFTVKALTGDFPAPKKGHRTDRCRNWHQGWFVHCLARAIEDNFGFSRSENDDRSVATRPSASRIIFEAQYLATNSEFDCWELHAVKKWALDFQVERWLTDALATFGPWFRGQSNIVDSNDVVKLARIRALNGEF